MMRINALALAISAALAGCDGAETANITVRQTGDRLVVQNDQGHALGKCWLHINGEFRRRGIDLPTGNTAVRLRAFTDDDGRMFDRRTHQVESVHVECKHPRKVEAYLSATSS